MNPLNTCHHELFALRMDFYNNFCTSKQTIQFMISSSDLRKVNEYESLGLYHLNFALSRISLKHEKLKKKSRCQKTIRQHSSFLGNVGGYNDTKKYFACKET